MKHRTRIQYTEADKALMWERWRRGESLNAIARLFDRNHSAIGGMALSPHVARGAQKKARRKGLRASSLPIY